MKQLLLGFFLFFFICITAVGQTTLGLGDIVFTGYAADDEDRVMFVLLAPVTSGTTVNFTDNGWFAAGGFRDNEGTVALTFNEDTPAGTEILVNFDSGVFSATASNGVSTTLSTVSGTIALSGSGDQIFAYQGPEPTGTDAPDNWVAAINAEGTGWQADATSSNTSALPAVFTEGTDAFAINENDNGFYTRVTTEGTAAALRTAIYTLADWTLDNANLLFSPECYSVTDAPAPPAADMPTLDGDMTFCPGESVDINVVAGDLNASAEWVLYSGSCGGTEIDRNVEGMFTVMPTGETTYFVRGEGCGTEGMCASFTVMNGGTDLTVTAPADITLAPGEDTSPANTGMAATSGGCAPPAMVMPWINELHYDNAGTDIFEFVEIAGPAGTDLTGWSVEFYNGNGGALYATEALSGTLADDTNGYGFALVVPTSIQNGAPDGLAIIDAMGNVVQFLSYEGTFTATSGAASGLTSEDIGVEEPSNNPEGFSLQLTGTGGQYSDFTWADDPADDNSLAPNIGQTFAAPTGGGGSVTVTFSDVVAPGVCPANFTITRTFTATDTSGNTATDSQTITVEDGEAPIIILTENITIGCLDDPSLPEITGTVTAFDSGSGDVPVVAAPWINEFHYDNTSTDVGEFFEIAGMIGMDMSGWSISLYNGSNDSEYNSIALTGTLVNGGGGFGFLTVNLPPNGIQNGPDAFALVDSDGTVVEFLSYEGVVTAADGPAAGLTSTDIGVFEGSGTPVGFSLQKTGSGDSGDDFTWSAPSEETPGTINNNQSSTLEGPIPTTFTESISADGRIITRVFSATDECGNTTDPGDFVQTIFVADNAPRLQCRQPTSTVTTPGFCVNNTLNLLPPFVFDDCGFGDEVTLTNDAPPFYPIGTTVVTFTATNSVGSATCQTEVIIADANGLTVDCGGLERQAFTQNPLACTATVTIQPTVEDACVGTPVVAGGGTFTFLPGTVNTQVVTITNPTTLESTTCEYIIYAHDTFAPVVTNCPDDITVTATGDLTQVTLIEPTATDNCGVTEITNDAPAAGFPLGVTTVNFMIKDAYGQWSGCSYDVIVNAGLTVSALSDIEASLEAENTTARVAWNEPNGTTPCAACAETNPENYRFLGVYRGHQYFLYEGGSTSRSEAVIMAETLDAQLVSINSENENRFLQNALNEDFSTVWTGLTATQNEEETVWNWLTAEDVTFQAFEEDYTAAEGANYGLLQADGTWTLTDDAAQHAFLIERPCINFTQISPVLIDEDTGEETLLVCGSDFTAGEYEVTYRAVDMCGNEAEYTFDVTVEMPTADICTTGGTESSVFINNILIGEYEMPTGDDAGFGDYTEEEMVLYAVIDEETEDYTPVSLNISAGGNDAGEQLFYRLWLDTNHDGDFFDADEMLAEGMTAEDWTTELPAFTENVDWTRMRIMVSKYDYPEVCGETAQGEAEDYTVSVLETIVRPGDDTRGGDTPPVIDIEHDKLTPYLSVWPNPVQTKLSVNTADFIGSDVTLTLVNQLGQVVDYQKIDNVQNNRTVKDVSELAPGFYTLSLTTANGEVRAVKVVKK